MSHTSFTTETVHVYTCDKPGCGRSLIIKKHSELQTQHLDAHEDAAKNGWGGYRSYDDYQVRCLEHAQRPSRSYKKTFGKGMKK